MKLYPFVKPLLFNLEPETAHTFTLKTLKVLDWFNLLSAPKSDTTPTKIMGIEFPNKIGLAAGLDKNGDYIDCLAKCGFGHIEIGTITPKPQSGNPKPRLFRLPEAQAIINRMGFNNKGVDYLIEQVKQCNYKGILGINIGKNASTALEKAIDDYVFCLDKVYPFAGYVTVNISSPNTPDLRNLQQEAYLDHLLETLKQQQQKLADRYKKYVPLVVKVAPDLTTDEIQLMCESLLAAKIDGVIATNTTVSREGVLHLKHANEKGGLSGQPLFERSTAVLREFHSCLQNDIPLIASGGIISAIHASEKLKAGAKLLQVYTGFIYNGPEIIRELANLQL